MPTYDYRCSSCGRDVEVVHGIHEAGPATCQICGGDMRKALSPPAIVFRGGGWAKKDARSASASKKKEPATSEAGSSEHAASTGDVPAKGSAKAGASGTTRPNASD